MYDRHYNASLYLEYLIYNCAHKSLIIAASKYNFLSPLQRKYASKVMNY